MKLHQEICISEKQGPVPVVLTLDEIINTGKATNHYQIFTLSWVSEFFKSGGLSNGSLVVGNPVSYGDATSTESINAIKQLTAEDQVSLAKYLKRCVEIGECLLSNCEMNTYDWICYILHAQR
jgi:hypothetical protein